MHVLGQADTWDQFPPTPRADYSIDRHDADRAASPRRTPK